MTLLSDASAVFAALEDHGVRWCWYKGYLGWPDAVGGDVDLAVQPGCMSEAVAAVAGVARRLGAAGFVPCPHADVMACFVVWADRLLEVDFQDRMWIWRGAGFLRAEEVVASRRPWRGVWVPAAEHALLFALLLYVFAGGTGSATRSAAADWAMSCFAESPSRGEETIRGILGAGRLTDEVIASLQGGDKAALMRLGSRARTARLAQALVRPERWTELAARVGRLYVGRLGAVKCGVWRGYGRKLQPRRRVADPQAWLQRVIRSHAGAWAA